MNRLFLLLATISLLFVSCDSDKIANDDLGADLKGCWVINTLDGNDLLPNDYFVMTFDGVSTQDYGIRVADGDNSSWFSTSKNYSIDGDVVTISDKETSLVFKVLEADDHFKFKVISYTFNGVDQQESGAVYRGYKTTTQYQSTIEGQWQGVDARYIDDSELYEANKHLWTMNNDGSFYYQSFNTTTQEWEQKSDNDGRYWLHGDILVFEFSNNHLTGVEGRTCELWKIEIENTNNKTTMEWEADRQDNTSPKFYLEKI